MEEIENLIDDLRESIDQRIKFFEAMLENESDKGKRKFIEGNIAGLRLSKILIPLKETVGVNCEDV